MEIITLITALAIFSETSVILAKTLKKESKKTGRRKIFVDTSALIDGRILAVAKSGFIGDDLLIPRSVMRELQLLADGKDKEKRTLARRGMDIARELERVVFCNTEIFEDELDRTPVDERLISLAKEYHGLICTNDFNLNKVAAAEHIDILNVNDLALSLQGNVLPGTRLHLKITEKGSNRGQGVGHLDDGTMVVVDHASKCLNKEISAEVIRAHQTSAGRMIFAKKI